MLLVLPERACSPTNYVVIESTFIEYLLSATVNRGIWNMKTTALELTLLGKSSRFG
jgi:hypothetical protein